MTSSTYSLPVNAKSSTTLTSDDILNANISITSEMVSPGGGGILRLYFSFIFTSSPAKVSIYNNGENFKGELNADNSSDIVSNGYYRFDLDVESGDELNLRASSVITTVHFVRADLVQFGA